MSSFKSVIGVVPARYASTRFPGKPLALIHGRPMVEWVVRASRKVLPRTIVATDDKRIFDAVKRFGGEPMMTPVSCASGTDRMAFVAKNVKAAYYVNIQGDEPLINPDTIRDTVRLAVAKKTIATTATRLSKDEESNPNCVKVVLDKNGRALYFSRSMIPFDRDRAGTWKGLKHTGLYVYPRAALLKFVSWPPAPLEKIEKLEQLRALYQGIPIYVSYSRFDSIGVDTPENLAAVGKILKRTRR